MMNIKMTLKQLISLLILSVISCTCLANEGASTTGIGAVAVNLMEPVNILSDFVQSACFIIGGSFLFASVIKYFEHKRSPLMVPISTVVFLFVLGLVLAVLPFLSLMVDYGVKFSLMK